MRKGMTLEFKVTQQEITRLDSQKVYEKTKGYLYAHFVFSDDWEGYLKTVKFSNLLDNSYIGVTLASDNTCMVPYTLILYPGVTFCIEGTSHGDIITTNDFVFDVDESNSTVPEVPTDNYVEITSNDFTIKDDKIVFSNYIANEIMNMNKRIKADYSFVEDSIPQGKFIAVLTPRAIIDYSSFQEGLRVYEYSTTNWLLDKYRTTYVEFFFDKNTEQLYLLSNNPTTTEDHIVGFDTSWDDRITLTSNSDMCTSTINPLRINDLSTTSIRNQPNLLFTANDKDELERVEFKRDGYSSDFTYTIPKGAKHYVVNELPTTTDIDKTGNYYVMTESVDGREYQSTDIHNLTPTEYPSSNNGALRQDATVNSDWVKLNATTVSTDDYMGDIAIKFNIPCTVTLSVNPRQTRLAFMYIDVNGVNVKLVNAGETYTYTRVFGVNETLCVRGESSSTNQFYYKLAIQPYTIDGKIPLSSNVEEYINYENMWFKNGGGSTVVANPTLSGDEATLDGLEVDGTKYKVGGGSGTITLDAIVDKNGNNRFVEGSVTPASITGITINYKKWSLSGSHLMIVLVGTVSSNLTDYTTLASVTFPAYIQSKIHPLGKSAQLVSVTKGFLIKNTEYIATEYNFNLKKISNEFRIAPEQAITISGTYNFRIQFDLLIDTD